MDIPTILLPGIKGTTLVNTNTLDFDTIWSGIQCKFETIFDLELQFEPRFETDHMSIIKRSDDEHLTSKNVPKKAVRAKGIQVDNPAMLDL